LAVLGILQEADEAPTTQMTSALSELEPSVQPLISRWQELKGKEIAELNKKLREAHLPELKAEENSK
jgi:hypothetical protein